MPTVGHTPLCDIITYVALNGHQNFHQNMNMKSSNLSFNNEILANKTADTPRQVDIFSQCSVNYNLTHVHIQ